MTVRITKHNVRELAYSPRAVLGQDATRRELCLMRAMRAALWASEALANDPTMVDTWVGSANEWLAQAEKFKRER